ncbi:MAG TPA: VCBS repeat-containing protein, partial [Planctomycetota bacterium]|nr:VCBS repeat-containing protein [Planctomycetota bacterium]
MRVSTGLFLALAGLAPSAPAQRFGFEHRVFPEDSDASYAIALGDVDGDGDLDAFVGNHGPDRLCRNEGMGAFTDVTATSLSTPSDETYAVALGDVDGDGDLDAFVGNEYSNRLYLNGGTGVFTDVTPTNLPSLISGGYSVALGDVDGDGDLDAFVGYGFGNFLYLNGGTGTFTTAPATNVPYTANVTAGVALGDVDGDGDLDALLGRHSVFGYPNRLFMNNGAGIFTDVSATNLPYVLDYTRAVALRDVDGDGDLDAFVGNDGQDRLHLNGGTGVFTEATATNLPVLLDDTRAVALGDVDGDGDFDAVIGNGGQDRLYLNSGTGVFSDATAANLPARLDPTEGVALGDLDGDGDLDLVVANDDEQNRLQLNDGGGGFTDVTDIVGPDLPVVLDPTTAVALGDVDGDGDLDAFVGNASFPVGALNRLYLNGGAGVFADATATNLPSFFGGTQAVALGDMDGDGDLDAFVGNAAGYPSGGQSRLFLNGGAGLFADASSNLPPLFADTRAIAFGDVDGDGDLDLFLGNLGQSLLWLNGGSGVFANATATNVPAFVGWTRAASVGDVDGDGDLDLFVGNFSVQDRLYLNGGTGVFADATAANLPALVGWTTAAAPGDVDGDGDLDLLVATAGPQNRLYLNGGTGAFTDATAANLPAVVGWTTAVALGDADEDGDLDALLAFVGVPP